MAHRKNGHSRCDPTKLGRSVGKSAAIHAESHRETALGPVVIDRAAELTSHAALDKPAPETSASHRGDDLGRSEEHTSELQSLMRISYAVFCLKKKKP